MKKVILPGSFDPITLGHLDIIKKAARLFDEVVVCVCTNSEKRYMFSSSVRAEAAKVAVKDIPNVRVRDTGETLVAEVAAEENACAIVKGARDGTDYDYEQMLSRINERLGDGLISVIIPASASCSYISSSYVRDLIKYKKPLDGATPAGVAEVLSK